MLYQKHTLIHWNVVLNLWTWVCKEALTESVGGSGQKKKVIRVLLVKTKTKNIEIYSFLLSFIIVTFMFCTGTEVQIISFLKHYLYWRSSFPTLNLVPKIVPTLKSGSKSNLRWFCCPQTANSCIIAYTKPISALRLCSESVCLAYVHVLQQLALLELVQKTSQRQFWRHAIYTSLSEEKHWLLLGRCVKKTIPCYSKLC